MKHKDKFIDFHSLLYIYKCGNAKYLLSDILFLFTMRIIIKIAVTRAKDETSKIREIRVI